MALAAEADALPQLLSHGDACPNNLLAGEHDDELVMIDFGFWGGAPVGFDLTQLLVGDVQIGKRGARGPRRAGRGDRDGVRRGAARRGLRDPRGRRSAAATRSACC